MKNWWNMCRSCGARDRKVRLHEIAVQRAAGVSHGVLQPRGAGGGRMKIYIAGKITGDPKYRDRFREAALQKMEGKG